MPENPYAKIADIAMKDSSYTAVIDSLFRSANAQNSIASSLSKAFEPINHSTEAMNKIIAALSGQSSINKLHEFLNPPSKIPEFLGLQSKLTNPFATDI